MGNRMAFIDEVAAVVGEREVTVAQIYFRVSD
jgi:hypothetical protein